MACSPRRSLASWRSRMARICAITSAVALQAARAARAGSIMRRTCGLIIRPFDACQVTPQQGARRWSGSAAAGPGHACKGRVEQLGDGLAVERIRFGGDRLRPEQAAGRAVEQIQLDGRLRAGEEAAVLEGEGDGVVQRRK